MLRYADSAYLLLSLQRLVVSGAPVLCPPRLGGLPERLAADLRADVPPARRTEADSLPLYWRRRKLSARYVEHLQREIDQDLRRKPALPHDALQRHASPHTQTRRQILGDLGATHRTILGS